MTLKRSLVSLVGLMLVLSASACGATDGSQGPYDATATYKCLKKRPELRPFGWEPGLSKGPLPASGITLELFPPKPLRFTRAFVPDLRIRGRGAGWEFSVQFEGPRQYGEPNIAETLIFDSREAAAKTYQDFFLGWTRRGLRPFVIAGLKKEFVLERNAIIDFLWVLPVPVKTPKQYRSIILGCLRTR